VIVDTGANLNIYTAAANCDDIDSSNSMEKSKGCCETSRGCCGNEIREDEELKGFVNKYRDADFNEWAGE
jgi:hypothetical protein